MNCTEAAVYNFTPMAKYHPLSPYWHRAVTAAKRLIYWRGEPYRIDGRTLRFVPGTRPIRLKYASAENWVNRYDALQLLWMWERLSDGDTAIDIGAHVGIYSVLMAAKCGQRGKVIAFEPDPYSRQVIAQNLRLNPNVKPPRVEASACSDQPGTGTFFSGHGDGRSALVASIGISPEAITVPVVALDEYIRQHRLQPRVVKIDSEGAEIKILRGATQLLESDAAILCELHPYAWPQFGDTFSELKEVLERSGRWMHYLDSDQPLTADPRYGMVVLEKASPAFLRACC